MRRRTFLGCAVTGASPLLSPRPVFTAPEPNVFPYRGWSFCVYSYDWGMLEAYVDAALGRAKEWGINTFELHDYTIGRRGLVDAAVRYTSFPKLATKEVLHYRKEAVTRSKKESDYRSLRDLVRKIKNHGLKLNCWYHVMRDAPAELASEYPEIGHADSGFYFRFQEELLNEFFERLPEVDRITITSLHETPSILARPGAMGREERLLKLYGAIHNACRRAGKELIIRDFIVRHEDFASFWNVLAKLPPDIYLMTKEVLADWTHMDMPLNPFLHRYGGRKLIVEFDLYGEYWGRLDIPACYPEYIHRQIRNIKAFDVLGAVGRVVHEDQRSAGFDTIFDSPNEINCYAFARLLSRPLPWLSKGSFTDPREQPGRWGWDLDAFDKKIWMEWASRRYGRKAAVPVIRALERTDQIVSLIIDIGGRGFQAHSVVPGVRSVSFLWEPFVDQVEALGMDFLRDEKQQAMALTRYCLEDIRSAKDSLPDQDYSRLIRLFEGELLIIRGYQAVLEGYYELYLAQKRPERKQLQEAAKRMRDLATEVAGGRGEEFFGGLPRTLREMAEYIEAGKVPAKMTGS